jgi:hypothetical protein
VVRIRVALACLPLAFSVPAAPLDGNSQIRAKTGDSEIVITTTVRLAGAIDSLKWRGKEFINSSDHGRQLQSACSFDNTPNAGAETFNPTEAGALDDGAGSKSTSRLLELAARKNHLHTKTQMAFWLAPGECSEGQPARNTNTLSNCVLIKDVTIGTGHWPQALDYRVTFSFPPIERHRSAQFEALTGYMPEEFNTFYQFDREANKLVSLSLGPGESKNPVVLATADGQFAMGIFSPPQSAAGMTGPTYGRWFFDQGHVSKWNCVFRVRDDAGLRGGNYRFRMLVLVGTLGQVQQMLRECEAL